MQWNRSDRCDLSSCTTFGLTFGTTCVDFYYRSHMQVVTKSCWGPTSKSGVVWTRDKYLAILVESHLAISKISNKDSTWQFLTNRTRCVTTGRGTRHRGILQLMEIPFIKFSKALTVSFIHKVGLQWRLGYLPTETYPVESQLTWTLLELQILIIAFSLWGKKKKNVKKKNEPDPNQVYES